MTDVADLGQVVINRNADGSYDRFAINSRIDRDDRSYESVRKQEGVNDYQGLDKMTLYKRDLNGNIVDSDITHGWQTVANGYKERYLRGNDHNRAYTHAEVNREETIAANSNFYMRFGNFQVDDYSGNTFVINRANTIGDGWLDKSSNHPEYRNLGHSDKDSYGNLKSTSDGFISAGCFVNSVDTLNDVQNQINDWGITYPYDVSSTIYDRDYQKEFQQWLENYNY